MEFKNFKNVLKLAVVYMVTTDLTVLLKSSFSVKTTSAALDKPNPKLCNIRKTFISVILSVFMNDLVS